MLAPKAPILTPAPPATPADIIPAELSTECYTRLDQLYPLVPEWEALAARAAEPNVFYEPWMMLPALEQFHAKLRLEIVAVYAGDGAGRRLVGLFPFERRWRLQGMPVRALRSLRYYYCSLCTPLIDRELRQQVAAKALAAVSSRAAELELSLVGADGPVMGWLTRAAGDYHGLRHTEPSDRAFMRRAASAELYVSTTFRREHKKKDLARLERRLQQLGVLRMQSLQAGEALDPWLADFLALEAAGWKGQQNSALASVPGGAGFFRRVCQQARARGRLEMHALRLDEQPLAQMCLVRMGDGLIFLRTAYDENYAQYSPGLLLAFKFSYQLHQRPGIEWIDSCSAPNARMANRVWKDRRPLAGLHVQLRPDSRLSRGLDWAWRSLKRSTRRSDFGQTSG